MGGKKRKPVPYLKWLYRREALIEFLLERAKTPEEEERLRKRLVEIKKEIARERGEEMLRAFCGEEEK